MKTPEPEHPQLPEDLVRGKAPRPARRDLVPLPAWPGCTVPLGAAGASMELPGSRQSPTPWPVETHPEPGRLPSPPVLLSDRSKRYYAPLRHPPPSPPIRGGEGRDPSRRWASRVAPCSVSTCHAPYPGEGPRGHRSVAPTESGGLPWLKNRSTLTTALSRLAQASRTLRPVDLQIRPRRTDVPWASTSQLPS